MERMPFDSLVDTVITSSWLLKSSNKLIQTFWSEAYFSGNIWYLTNCLTSWPGARNAKASRNKSRRFVRPIHLSFSMVSMQLPWLLIVNDALILSKQTSTSTSVASIKFDAVPALRETCKSKKGLPKSSKRNKTKSTKRELDDRLWAFHLIIIKFCSLKDNHYVARLHLASVLTACRAENNISKSNN